jgi:hypothetical protein
MFEKVLKVSESAVLTYYMVKTDDSVQAIGGVPDKHFELWDIKGLSNYIANFELCSVLYWVEIEEFDTTTDSIISSINLIDKRICH